MCLLLYGFMLSYKNGSILGYLCGTYNNGNEWLMMSLILVNNVNLFPYIHLILRELQTVVENIPL